jgi:hypothetical protein
MGTIPVANPSPPRRLGLPRRGLRITVVLFAVVVAIVVGLAFVWPTGPKVDRPSSVDWVSAGQAGDFRPFQPVLFREDRFWLVRLGETDFVALSTRDPKGCTVPWRPDFEFLGKKSWFRDPCYSSTYDIAGRLFFGPSPRSLDRFPVRVEHGEVQVLPDPAKVSPGPAAGPEYIPCDFSDPFWTTSCLPRSQLD